MSDTADGSNLADAWSRPTAYERWYASSLGRAYAASLESVLGPWLTMSPGERALDVGCGPGLALERLFPADCDVVGLDCAHATAVRALIRSRSLGLRRAIVVGSVERLPFPDATFHLVSCINCLEFVGDRRRAFGELSRVLTPGGRLAVGVLNVHSLWEMSRRLWRRFSRRPYYGGRFFTRRELQSYCREAGLTVDETKVVAHFPPIPPGPLAGLYWAADRMAQRHRWNWGGVVLCRAARVTP